MRLFSSTVYGRSRRVQVEHSWVIVQVQGSRLGSGVCGGECSCHVDESGFRFHVQDLQLTFFRTRVRVSGEGSWLPVEGSLDQL